MARSPRFSPWFLATVSCASMLVGCSLEQRQDATIRVDLRDLGPQGQSSAWLGAGLVRPGGANSGLFSLSPSGIGDLNCAFVNVTAADIPNLESKPKPTGPLGGGVCGYTYAGVLSGAVATGTDTVLELKVPRGSERLVQVIGFQTDLSCASHSPAEWILAADKGTGSYWDTHFSDGFELGKTIASIQADTAVEIANTFNLTSSRINCHDSSSNGGNGYLAIGGLRDNNTVDASYAYGRPTLESDYLRVFAGGNEWLPNFAPPLTWGPNPASPPSTNPGLLNHKATRLQNGAVIVTGGGWYTKNTTFPYANAFYGTSEDVYALKSDRSGWVHAPVALGSGTGRGSHAAVRVNGDRVLILGGARGPTINQLGIVSPQIVKFDGSAVTVQNPLGVYVGTNLYQPAVITLNPEETDFLVAGGFEVNTDVTVIPTIARAASWRIGFNIANEGASSAGLTVSTVTGSTPFVARAGHATVKMPITGRVVVLGGVGAGALIDEGREDYQVFFAETGTNGEWAAERKPTDTGGSGCDGAYGSLLKRKYPAAVALDATHILVVGGLLDDDSPVPVSENVFILTINDSASGGSNGSCTLPSGTPLAAMNGTFSYAVSSSRDPAAGMVYVTLLGGKKLIGGLQQPNDSIYYLRYDLSAGALVNFGGSVAGLGSMTGSNGPGARAGAAVVPY